MVRPAWILTPDSSIGRARDWRFRWPRCKSWSIIIFSNPLHTQVSVLFSRWICFYNNKQNINICSYYFQIWYLKLMMAFFTPLERCSGNIIDLLGYWEFFNVNYQVNNKNKQKSERSGSWHLINKWAKIGGKKM